MRLTLLAIVLCALIGASTASAGNDPKSLILEVTNANISSARSGR